MGRLRWVCLFSALSVALVACSGGGTAGRNSNDNAAVSPGTTGDPAESAPPVDGSLVPSAGPTQGATAGPGKTPGRTKGGGSIRPPGGGGPAPTGYPIPNLFTSAENTIGISNEPYTDSATGKTFQGKITLCTHAALSLSAVFKVTAADLNVYWKYINDEFGGVYGRYVDMSYTDDNYGNQPSDVTNAYEQCKAKNPFILLGGIGFDQIPAVRAMAEEDHQLYIHHIAREDFSKKYSFSYLASVETIGRIAAQWILKEHPDKKNAIGVIYRESDNWEPGHQTFKQELGKHGVTVVSDQGAQKSASVYSQQIKALSDAGAQIVFIWENALSAIEIVKQAKQQLYSPKWLVFPFNLMTDTLGKDTADPSIEGVATWPAYWPGETGGSYAPYADEIKLFEQKHQQYAENKDHKDDIVWMTWLGWHQLHQLLLDCSKSCTRNKIVGLLQSNTHKSIFSDCPLDFSRNGHVGGFFVNTFEAEMQGDVAGWKNRALCRKSF